MPVNDPVSDMLTRIRNASLVRHGAVKMPASRTKLAIGGILKEEGYIKNCQFVKDSPQGTIEIELAYFPKRRPAIGGLRRISKPGLRIYAKKGNVPRSHRGIGISIITTSQGIMTGYKAQKLGIGGELMCYVW